MLRSHSPYIPSTRPKRCGITAASLIDSGSEARIRYGVSSVVIAETVTAIGYRNSLVTCSVRPSAAMMNENSPICERPMPTRSEVRRSLPAMNAPSDTGQHLADAPPRP